MADKADKPDKKFKLKQGKQKIQIAFIKNQTTRKQTFRKRNGGLYKKAYELAVLCGAQVVVKVDQNEPKGKSETFHYYSWKPDHENKIPKYNDGSSRTKSSSKSKNTTVDEKLPPPPPPANEAPPNLFEQQQQIFDEDDASLVALLDDEDYVDVKGSIDEILGEALGNVFY
ncbi:MADS-box protein 04g005320 [Selaginella moellendorffii]|uniref:MADS-box protein 04g005320 n=1 Tax=Selaginella moellendorffii TaxID=88036 RepID=UPI000D1C27DD|nr:MADS-box protein 04g005320 [Selaginella moellendorffii]|eukprot:XP_024531297.1 MADS-box protein 04g005320 [Selaginella moellendorffii]